MYVVIDYGDAPRVKLYYWLNTKWVQWQCVTSGGRSLASRVSELLERSGKSIKDLRGIAVVSKKKGSFTAARVAATTANILAYARRVPAVIMSDFTEAPPSQIFAGAPLGRYVSARYSGAAHIGKSKK